MLIPILAFAADAPKPKPLAEPEKLKLAQAALLLSVAENDYRRLAEGLKQAQQNLEAKDKAYRALLDAARKASGAETCDLDLAQNWLCKPEQPTK